MSNHQRLLIETQYFPPLEFFKRAAQYPILQIEAFENYQKRSYRNRCIIAGPNGIQMLTVPLTKGKNEQHPIKDTTISYVDPWQKKHWQAIQTAYGKSPFFEYYAVELKPVFEKKWQFLFDLNLEILSIMKELLQLSFELETSTDFIKNPPDQFVDFRSKMAPKNREDFVSEEIKYPQVFEAKNGFLPNLSILDLLFCLGPEGYYILED